MSQQFINIDPNSATLDDLAEKTFYGVKLVYESGQAVVDRIYGDEPIVFPQEGFQNSSDYVNWMFTNNTLNFYWQNNGHLLLEVL